MKGAQYMQIRVIVTTHNYGVSAGEIIQKRTVVGPAQGSAKIYSSIAVESIFLPSLLHHLLLSLSPFSPSFPFSIPSAPTFSPSSRPVTCCSTANAFFVSSLMKTGTWHIWGKGGIGQ